MLKWVCRWCIDDWEILHAISTYANRKPWNFSTDANRCITVAHTYVKPSLSYHAHAYAQPSLSYGSRALLCAVHFEALLHC
jgi:hypothetical protein